MTRAWFRTAAGLALAACLLLVPRAAAVRAGDDPSADAFRRAELAERSLGDLERAAQLYRDAARAAGAADSRATADVRAASCLRRLGRVDEARTLLAQWVKPSPGVSEDVRRAAETELALVSAPPPAAASATSPAAAVAADGAARLADKERELEQTRQDLESTVGRSKEFQADLAALAQRVAELAQKVRERDAELARLRAEQSPAAPTTAEEVLALRLKQRREAKEVARTYFNAARLLYQDGRFAEAREYLWLAIERDPEDADAKALLTLVAAPLGDRAALFQRAIELAALAREVRSARRAAEVSHLVDEARRRQERGDFAGSSAPLETALATIDAAPGLVRGGQAIRGEVARMLQAAVARGVARRPAAPPALPPAEERWTGALRDLLTDAGGEVEQGLDLRFHDLGAVLASTGLPPAPFGAEPMGWTVSGAQIDGAPLLAAWLAASEGRALAAPGAALALDGSMCVLLTDIDTHRRVADRLAALRLGAPPAAEVRIAAYRVDRNAVADVLAARGIVATTLADGARSASLDPQDLDALLAALPQVATGVLGAASLRTTPLRPFSLTAGPASAQLRVEAVSVPGARPGIGLRASVSWAPPERAGGPTLRAEATTGAGVPPGGGLVLTGLPDPARPAEDLAIVVRLGAAPPAPGTPLPPPAPPEHSADELRVPGVVARVEDSGAPPLLVPEHPVASRTDALLRRLRRAAPRARHVEMRGDRVLVVGPEEDRRGAADLLAQFEAAPEAVRLDVRFHEVQQKTEDDLRRICPRRFPAEGGALEWSVLAAGEARTVDLLLRGAGTQIALRDGMVVAPPTGRGDVVRIVRSQVRSGSGAAPGGAAWGRSESAWTDEGLAVSLRPFGQRKDGRVDLDVSARARWISDLGRRDVETPFGRTPILDPRASSWWGDLDTPLARGEVLLLVGGRSPFAAGDGGRIVVTVRLAE